MKLITLLEYDRSKTISALGKKLAHAAASNASYVNAPQGILASFNSGTSEPLINHVLNAIELKDPTPNKEYVQWLARAFINQPFRIEDINRDGRIEKFHNLKRKKKVSPEHSDINRIKTYSSFEDIIDDYPDELTDKREEYADKEATVYYDGADARAIIPTNQSAACYYGRGTKWCTAAKKGNMFDHYNSEGRHLLIILPKRPKETGEKYQVWVNGDQAMDVRDDPVNFLHLLNSRFTGLREHIGRDDQFTFEFVSGMGVETYTDSLRKVESTIGGFAEKVDSYFNRFAEFYRLPVQDYDVIGNNVQDVLDAVQHAVIESGVSEERLKKTIGDVFKAEIKKLDVSPNAVKLISKAIDAEIKAEETGIETFGVLSGVEFSLIKRECLRAVGRTSSEMSRNATSWNLFVKWVDLMFAMVPADLVLSEENHDEIVEVMSTSIKSYMKKLKLPDAVVRDVEDNLEDIAEQMYDAMLD